MFCVLVTEAWFARLHLEHEDDERFAKYHSDHAKGALGGFQRHKGLPKLTTKDVPLRSIAKFPRQRARLILDLNGQNDYAVEGITEDREDSATSDSGYNDESIHTQDDNIEDDDDSGYDSG